jgi:DNA-binding PadR family transcriptional regulator
MKHTIIRGKILDLLKKVYPNGVDEITVISILYQYHKTEEIYASLEYLVDKDYVEKKQQPHPFLERECVRWYKLKPRGVDLLEGNVDPDPGILIQRG